MHPTEKVVRQCHDSWDMRDPEQGAEGIAEDCAFKDAARRETQPGKAVYLAILHRPGSARRSAIAFMRVKDGTLVERDAVIMTAQRFHANWDWSIDAPH